MQSIFINFIHAGLLICIDEIFAFMTMSRENKQVDDNALGMWDEVRNDADLIPMYADVSLPSMQRMNHAYYDKM